MKEVHDDALSPEQLPNAAPSAPQVNLSNGKKAALPALIVVAAFALIAGALWVMWKVNNNQAADTDQAAKVNISDKGFTPATLKVKKGQNVTWTNTDIEAHHILANNSTDSSTPGFDSQDSLNQQATYTYTFNSAGTFNYHDERNPDMLKGTVIVE